MATRIVQRPAQSHADHQQFTQATSWSQHHEAAKTQTSGAARPPYSPPRTAQASGYYGDHSAATYPTQSKVEQFTQGVARSKPTLLGFRPRPARGAPGQITYGNNPQGGYGG